jgi:hypothetical protein
MNSKEVTYKGVIKLSWSEEDHIDITLESETGTITPPPDIHRKLIFRVAKGELKEGDIYEYTVIEEDGGTVTGEDL